MEEIIKFDHVSKHFGGVKALTDVTLSIKKGQVHALLGENGAGKSTLMNILSGLFLQDSGKIIYKGKETKFLNPHVSRAIGIATVFQELKNCENLTVTENIFLGREEKKGIVVDWTTMNKKAKKILESYGLDIDVKTTLSKLTVAQMQLIEIAKAIDLNADVLILDEPTSALTINETSKLFDNIRKLKEKGVTIIFISHRLEEVFQISDELSVLRNGKFLGTFDAKEMTVDEIIKLIAGKELASTYSNTLEKKMLSEKVLEVKNVSRGSVVKNASFDLHKGEILGFYGLQGSGRTELMELVFGIQKKDSGEIRAYGKELTKISTKNSIKNKIGMLTEDRKLSGVFFHMDINDNIAIIHDRDITKAGLIDTKRVNTLTNSYIKKLSIKCSSMKQLVGNLSGGNQQKVIISRCLSTQPDIIIMDEPTKGVDVGAKAEIYEILKNLREKENKSMI
ncbi:MAG: sugar ABC transporter ATP-binding protein, partial [Christensenellaceae bacterium]